MPKRAHNVENRENQLIAAAYDLAEKRIREGTASNSLLVYFLGRGNRKAKLEQEIMTEQSKLVRAKTTTLEDAKNQKEIAMAAIDAMKRYSGHADDEDV